MEKSMEEWRREQERWREIGLRIRHFRRSKGMTVDELASAVGVVREQIVRLEAGATGTKVIRLEDIAEVLGVAITDLLGPRKRAEEDDLQVALRGRGVSEDAIAKAVEYIKLLELAEREELRAKRKTPKEK